MTNTNPQLQNTIIYELDVRNYSSEGNFKAVQRDLRRIKQLGVDIIWLMPIYPIGLKNRKGSLGSPYSIKDHRQINPEFGTIADFIQLVTGIHENGMKIMIDIVFNHTSLDSWLFQNHPEWFYRDENGAISRKVPDWDDVIDLDYRQPELWAFQMDTLKYWINQGVDGFRCDVAPLVPLEFWKKARIVVQELKPNIIWLAESADPEFILNMRRQGITVHSDCELYQTFDITYDYDVFLTFHAYLQGIVALEQYLQLLRSQETCYSSNYIKLRFLENHDQPRIGSLISSLNKLLLWTAFIYFHKGATLLYAGQEALDDNRPNLFEQNLVNWGGLNIEFNAYLQKLANIKKDPIFRTGYYHIHHASQSGIILASYEDNHEQVFGIFNIEGNGGIIKVKCPDGKYLNLVNAHHVIVDHGLIELQPDPVIFKVVLTSNH